MKNRNEKNSKNRITGIIKIKSTKSRYITIKIKF